MALTGVPCGAPKSAPRCVLTGPRLNLLVPAKAAVNRMPASTGRKNEPFHKASSESVLRSTRLSTACRAIRVPSSSSGSVNSGGTRMFVLRASISNWALTLTGRPLASLPFNVMVWLPSRDSRATPASPYHVLRDWSGLKKTFFSIVSPLSAERASAEVTVNRHGEPLSMTFGSIEIFHPCGADEGKTCPKEADALSALPTGDFIEKALGESAACWVAAGAVLSLAYVASSSAAVRITLQLMLFGFFIPDPFVIGNCSADHFLGNSFRALQRAFHETAPGRRRGLDDCVRKEEQRHRNETDSLAHHFMGRC